MSELLPCPHCGIKPPIDTTKNITAGNGTLSISCCATMAEGFILSPWIDKNNLEDGAIKAEARLVKRWNTRVNQEKSTTGKDDA